MSVRMPDDFDFDFDGWSVVHPMLNFGDSLDGSSTLRGVNTFGAVVCQNTFQANLLGRPALFKIRHSANSQTIIDATLARLDASIAGVADAKAAVERLTNIAYTEAEFVGMLKHNDMLGARPAEDIGGGSQTKWDDKFASIIGRYNESDIDPIRSTKLGALMAIQGWEQHVGTTTYKGNDPIVKHTDSIIFGEQPMTATAARLIGVGTN